MLFFDLRTQRAGYRGEATGPQSWPTQSHRAVQSLSRTLLSLVQCSANPVDIRSNGPLLLLNDRKVGAVHFSPQHHFGTFIIHYDKESIYVLRERPRYERNGTS